MHFQASRARLAAIAALLAGRSSTRRCEAAAGRRPSAPPDTIERWLAAVNAHTAGELDDAAKTVAVWPDEHLTYTFNQVTTAVSDSDAPTVRAMPSRKTRCGGSASGSQQTCRASLKRGAAAPRRHRDAGARPASRSRQGGAAAPVGSSVLVRDGEPVGLEGNRSTGRSGARWSEACSRAPSASLPDSVDPHASSTRSRVTGSGRRRPISRTGCGSPTSCRTRSRRSVSVPDDPVLLLFAGALHEHFGSPVVQTAIRVGDAAHGDGDRHRHPPRPSSIARSNGTSAPSPRTPRLAEAHIRLGRVLGQRGDHADAVAHADARRGTRRRSALEVLRGTVSRARGRTAEAPRRRARGVRAGGAALPTRPVAAAGAQPAGDGARRPRGRGGRRSRLLSLPSDPMARDDPWWSYEIRQRSDLERHLAEYYEIARAVR